MLNKIEHFLAVFSKTCNTIGNIGIMLITVPIVVWYFFGEVWAIVALVIGLLNVSGGWIKKKNEELEQQRANAVPVEKKEEPPKRVSNIFGTINEDGMIE